MSTLDVAKAYRAAGISSCPVRADGSKAPAVSWSEFQERLPSTEEIDSWHGNGHRYGIGVICGQVSGGLELIDVDDKATLQPFLDEIEKLCPGLTSKLTLIETPKGYHLPYRSREVDGNQKLAMHVVDGEIKARIETRGTGGYFIAPGSPSECHETGRTYEHVSGPPLTDLTTITAPEREILFQVARSFNEVGEETGVSGEKVLKPNVRGHQVELSPADDFNRRCEWADILASHNWKLHHTRSDGISHWTRPGKDPNHGWSATTGLVSQHGNELLCVFSNNAHPFEGANGFKPCTTYTKFAAYTLLDHGGDYSAAVVALAQQGYGPATGSIKITGGKNFLKPVSADTGSVSLPALEKFCLAELKSKYPTLNPPVLDGLIREGETGNVISTSKVGKSWLAYGLALSIITAQPWLYRFRTAPGGKVLLIDNELHKSTLANRIPAVGEAMELPAERYDVDLEIWPLRGNLRSLLEMEADFDAIKPGEFKAIILDAKYRFIEEGASENDNAAETRLYNLLDYYAEKTKAAFILVHHTSKGNQSEKRVTDVGSGAGAQSRAADCHLVLREHEEDDVVVLDAAVRSFAPVDPVALRWKFPLWIPDSDIDVSKLKGRLNAQEQRQNERDAEGIDQVTSVLKEGPATTRQLRKDTGIGLARIERLLGLMVSDEIATSREIKVRGNISTQFQLVEETESGRGT